jgi:hypothetical protein
MTFPFIYVCALVCMTRRVFRQVHLHLTEAQMFPGYDMTYNATEHNLTTIRMGEYLWKQKILNDLIDPNKSLYEKLHIYDTFYLPNQIYSPNLFSGGFARDWNFDSGEESTM